MPSNFEKCRWGRLVYEDIVCINSASEYEQQIVSKDENVCNKCNCYYSCIESENVHNMDFDTEELEC